VQCDDRLYCSLIAGLELCVGIPLIRGVPMISPVLSRKIRSALVFCWLLATIYMLVYACVKLSYDPTFRLGIGLIQIRGFIGVLIAIPMALTGTVSAILLWRGQKLGAQLLIAYSSFWSISLVVGAVADYIRHPSHVLVYGPGNNCVLGCGDQFCFSDRLGTAPTNAATPASASH
jgi:hypothetical protein